MRRISPLERLRLFGRAGIDIVATLGRSVLFLVSALFGRSRAGKPEGTNLSPSPESRSKTSIPEKQTERGMI